MIETDAISGLEYIDDRRAQAALRQSRRHCTTGPDSLRMRQYGPCVVQYDRVTALQCCERTHRVQCPQRAVPTRMRLMQTPPHRNRECAMRYLQAGVRLCESVDG